MLTTNGGRDIEVQSVWIQSKFSFGNCLLEAIDMIPLSQLKSSLKLKLIRTSVLLDNATVGMI